MNQEQVAGTAQDVARNAATLAQEAERVAHQAARLANEAIRSSAADQATVDPFIFGLTVFVLACFVGYYVVWKVTPALHAPLMSVANAISGVVILGAMVAAAPAVFGVSKIFGFFAVVLAAVNIFGGFIITHRMLDMFKSNKKR